MLGHVMLVDDDNFCNKMNTFVLQQHNAASRISPFTTASDALDYLEQALEQNKLDNFPDVLLLDLNMDQISGWDFLDRFKDFPDANRNKTSIYILTSSIMRSDKESASHNPNVRGYIEKPFTSDELEFVISLEVNRTS